MEEGINSQADIPSLSLAGDQSLPRIRTLPDDFHSILLVLAFAAESELVFWLAIWDLVDTEPLVCGTEETWEMTFDILNIVQFGGQWIVDINDNNLPVGFFLIEKCHDTKDFDLLDLTRVANQFTNFANIQWIIVTLGLGFWVNDIGVFPSL